MKHVSYRFGIAILCLNTFASLAANATMSPYLERGEEIIEHKVPGRANEVCIIPNHFAAAKYSVKDLANEKKLCGLDVYSNAAVCPKTSSTNPGLEMYSLPVGSSIRQVEAANCIVTGSEREAKYKMSTSCSYTPSIVGYYHLSRILGGIANVQPAVLRTFDLERHMEIGEKALRMTKSTDLIHMTWDSLMSGFRAGAASKRKDLLFTDNFDQSYGALLKNGGGGDFYPDFFNGGKENFVRAANFRDKNPSFALVKNKADASSLVSRSFSQANVQKMVQMKDAVDMVILDTLMNQQDRFGNIDAFDTYYFYDDVVKNDDGTPKLRSEKKPTPEQMAKAVMVKEMILKDNDCGVAKDNVARGASLAEAISHIDPKVYHRLLKLDSIADTEYVMTFFRKNLMFTADDYSGSKKGFRTNLKFLTNLLKTKCKAGTLKLDLDLDNHFSDQPLKRYSCDIAAN
ncbi:MAG: hypothetical protein V4692_01710 [Bdellovibrionota bacterium]